MESPWIALGLTEPPRKIDTIHDAYNRLRPQLMEEGDLMKQLAIEDAYMRALALWEQDEEYCEKAVLTDHIFDNIAESHVTGEPFTETELAEIATKIMRILHNPWQRTSKSVWKQIIDLGQTDDAKDRQFDAILREGLLRYLGYYNERAGQRNKSAGPRLMSPDIAHYIFEHAELIQTKPRSEKEGRELDWLRAELDVDASDAEMKLANGKDYFVVGLIFFCVVTLFFVVNNLIAR